MSNLWLFQLSADAYTHRWYRQEIWESQTSPLWNKRLVRGNDDPASGDRVVCWYARSVSPEPGIWGWGVIVHADESDIRWVPCPPSDLLKMAPLFTDALAECVARVRGSNAQGTMWQVGKSDAALITNEVLRHVGHPVPRAQPSMPAAASGTPVTVAVGAQNGDETPPA